MTEFFPRGFASSFAHNLPAKKYKPTLISGQLYQANIGTNRSLKVRGSGYSDESVDTNCVAQNLNECIYCFRLVANDVGRYVC